MRVCGTTVSFCLVENLGRENLAQSHRCTCVGWLVAVRMLTRLRTIKEISPSEESKRTTSSLRIRIGIECDALSGYDNEERYTTRYRELISTISKSRWRCEDNLCDG